MLIKEYRIPLPLSVDEYQIAQLYMIQKKSLEESQGTESGVEIIENEPYTDGPGGSGQHTFKIYHISKHIPGWLASLLPKNALIVEEEAWNAYPYTRTRYTCPFVEKFLIDIETVYLSDGGDNENAFEQITSERLKVDIDLIDIVKEKSSDYKKEEDPKLYQSKVTGRGPLFDDWLSKYKLKSQENKENIMCAYKRCKVEFKYWGMQSKIERFIHDVGLRKVMLRAHKQAWCWQDEWHGLTMQDIRKLEKKTQLALRQKFSFNSVCDEDVSENENNSKENNVVSSTHKELCTESRRSSIASVSKQSNILIKKYISRQTSSASLLSSRSKQSNSERYRSQLSLLDGKIEDIRGYSSGESSDNDEFFDCKDIFEDDIDGKDSSLSDSMISSVEWKSIEQLAQTSVIADDTKTSSIIPQSSVDTDSSDQLDNYSFYPCKISVLFLVLHGGNAVEPFNNGLASSKQNDVQTLTSTFDTVIQAHYRSAIDSIAFRLVDCPPVCGEAYQLLQSINPYGRNDPSDHNSSSSLMALFATSSPQYNDALSSLATRCNLVYNNFMESGEGKGFDGQICIIGDTIGSILSYDLLCHSTCLNGTSSCDSRRGSSLGNYERSSSYSGPAPPIPNYVSHLRHKSLRVSASSSIDLPVKLDFDVHDFFLLGSPLAIVLALRQFTSVNDSFNTPSKLNTPSRPACHHVYNLFYSADPSSARIEPLLESRFSSMPPATVVKYRQYPLGCGKSFAIGDLLSGTNDLFNDESERRSSEWSVTSASPIDLQSAGRMQNSPPNVRRYTTLDDATTTLALDSSTSDSSVVTRWWGEKRIDYALFCPEALSAFPSSALPHLFHSSFWESLDFAAFALRQVIKLDFSHMRKGSKKGDLFSPSIEKEKWQKKRTSVKLRNLTANHRAKDCVVLENQAQVILGRFSYGPLDLVNLTGEKVDVYALMPPPSSEWCHLATDVTNTHGKVTCTIPESNRLGLGIYPIKMVVRGDHTTADSHLAVVPPGIDCVVFSIDGSFTASVSLMGSDPKVQPGAVDVVRHWQDLGYMIIYVTGRPDIQKYRVVTWLAQHNFPHGMIWFGDGLSHEPIKMKALLLKNLKTECKLNYSAAYGSAKDIVIYTQMEIPHNRIFIIGKTSKKQAQQCCVIANGYSNHLNQLVGDDSIHAAKFNAQIHLHKGSFDVPCPRKSKSLISKKKLSRVVSKKSSSTD